MVCGAIIDEDKLKVVISLGTEVFHTLADVSLHLEDWNNDRDLVSHPGLFFVFGFVRESPSESLEDAVPAGEEPGLAHRDVIDACEVPSGICNEVANLPDAAGSKGEVLDRQ